MTRILMPLALLAFVLPALAQDEQSDPRKQELVHKLETMRISLDFKEAALDDVINFLREFTGINFYVDPDVRTKLSDDQLKVTLKVNDLLLKPVLKLMLGAKDLTAIYRDGVLVIATKDKAAASVTTRMYDVRDLLVKLQDFPGPKVELVGTAKGGTPLTGASFTLEEPKSVINEDFITEMVKVNTGDRSWDENPKCSITLVNGLLVVSQSKKTHEEIMRLLNLLRQFK